MIRCCLPVCEQGSTFGIPGVAEHAHFLRDVKQATAIREKLVKNVAKAGIPGEFEWDVGLIATFWSSNRRMES